jgi:hypothetical protein
LEVVVKTPLAHLVIGGLAFWMPDVFTAAIRRAALVDVIGPIPMTGLLPAIIIAVYFVARRYANVAEPAPSIALFLGTGVWLLGSLSMTLANTFLGAGFSTGNSVENVGWVLLLTVFPPGTFMMSTYGGSLGALILMSILMVILHVSYEREHWLVPPRVARFFRHDARS